MTTVVVASILILLVAVGAIGVVVVGIEGFLADRVPARVARQFRVVASHLEGEAAPPARVVKAVVDGRAGLRGGRSSQRGAGRSLRTRLASR